MQRRFNNIFMALDPETIKMEREKIPQFQTEGTITSSTLVEKGHERCIDTYESTLENNLEKTSFQYQVIGPSDCTIDAIYDIRDEPFLKNTKVSLSLTQEKPYQMVSSEVIYSPNPPVSPMTYFVWGGIFLIVAVLVIDFIKKRSTV